MTTGPKLRLSRLRHIGFSVWKPISLLRPDEGWKDKPFADEFDRYLMSAASLIRQGERAESVVQMLVDVEVNYMGLGEHRRGDAERRAKATVAAIQQDTELWNWG